MACDLAWAVSAPSGYHIHAMLPDPTFPTPALPADALRDRTVVITGASDGVGRALADNCAAAGAHLVMVGRNEAKTRHAASMLMTRTGNRAVHVEIADLFHLDEQAALADRLGAAYPALFALVNNAGSIFLDRAVTREGFERTFALNHVAYMSLALRLLPNLRAGALPTEPARIVNVASRAHHGVRIDPDDLQSTRGYTGWGAYRRSKLANILFTRSLAARVDPQHITVHALHPGLVASRFAVNNGRRGRIQRTVMNWFSISSEAGADTAAWLLASREGATTTGEYWARRKRRTPSRAARDNRLAEQLWDATIHLAGLEEFAGALPAPSRSA